ncbi:hypothetical protein Pan153_42540 [Gimesia panareensis]|uniref:Uncharacterized protein n=1 Tax=Gimesia panareensis TaxID=2527978 RepID=A0A518FTB4_9PLAN|nr:hypothetical protein [Gimesia panareensis]QDV19588.1 hypothetical protein Pan153_42540 [Gimesia panareensis]
MPISDQSICMCALETSAGPWLLLAGSREADFEPLRKLFETLSQSPATVLLELQPYISASGQISLELCSQTDPPSKDRFSLSQLKTKLQDYSMARLHWIDETAGSYQWSGTPKEWEERALLLEPLIRKQTPGHIYLTDSAADVADIVVSRGEYPDLINA